MRLHNGWLKSIEEHDFKSDLIHKARCVQEVSGRKVFALWAYETAANPLLVRSV